MVPWYSKRNHQYTCRHVVSGEKCLNCEMTQKIAIQRAFDQLSSSADMGRQRAPTEIFSNCVDHRTNKVVVCSRWGPKQPLLFFIKNAGPVWSMYDSQTFVHRGNKTFFFSDFRNERHMSEARNAALHNHRSCIYKKWVQKRFSLMLSMTSLPHCKDWMGFEVKTIFL